MLQNVSNVLFQKILTDLKSNKFWFLIRACNSYDKYTQIFSHQLSTDITDCAVAYLERG